MYKRCSALKNDYEFRRAYGRGRNAVSAGLVVYCLKNTKILGAPYGIPELISVVTVAVLHIWKRNNLLSIGIGTVLYMFLIQCIF